MKRPRLPKSLAVQVLGAWVAVALLMASMWLVTEVYFARRVYTAVQAQRAARIVLLQLVQAKLLQQQFEAAVVSEEPLFAEGDPPELGAYRAVLAEQLREIGILRGLLEPDRREIADQLLARANDYAAAFARLIAAYREQGSPASGREAECLKAKRRLEAAASREAHPGLLRALMALERADDAFRSHPASDGEERVHERVRAIEAEASAAGAAGVLEPLKAYAESFERYAATALEIGASEDEGLRGEVKAAASRLEPLARETVEASAVAEQRISRRFIGVTLASAALLLGAGTLIFYLFARSVNRRVKRLLGATERVRRGDFTLPDPVEAGDGDELAALASGFHRMVSEIGERDRALEEARARLERHVTERTRELSSERGFSEVVLGSFPGIVCMFGEDHRVERWNDNFRTVSGYEDAEIRGSDALEFISPEERPMVAEAMRRAMTEGWATIEARLLTKRGDALPYLLTGARFVSEKGRHLVGVGVEVTDLKRAEEERALQAAALTASANSIVITDREGTIVWVNPAFTKITGYTSEEAVGQNPRILKSGAHDREFYRGLWETVRAGRIWSGEMVNRRKDGTLYFEAMTITPVPHNNHFIAIKQDVTERKEAEQRLAEALDLNREIVSASRAGILAYDASGQCVLANQAVAEIVGGSCEQLLRQNFREIESWRASGLREAAEETLRTGVGRDREARFRSTFGKEGWVYARFAPFVSGGAPHLLVLFEDISVRKRAEAELRERDERFRQLVDNIDAVFWMIDAEATRFLYVSPAAERVWGRPAESFASLPDSFVQDVLEEDRRKAVDIARRACEGLPQEAEFRIRRPDGAVRWLWSRTFPIRDPEGVLRSTAGLTSDVTARREAEEELARAKDAALESSRLKSAFLANMSHEVRTPLNVITGFASLIDEHLHEIGDHSQDELFDGLRRSSKRLIDTIHGLLDLSSVESGTFSVRPKPIELSPFLREQVDRFTAAARGKGLWLELVVEEGAPAVTFDPYCLGRVVDNLVDNAIKFTERGGVRVRIHRDGGGVLCLSVSDTGVGVDPSYAPHLFERFSQEESGYTRHFEGAGIGLALVKRFVEMNGAEISFDSRKGAGATFTIRFDAVAVASARCPAAATPSNATLAVPTPHPVVLVVEDDDLTQDLLAVALRNDYDLLRATTAAEARGQLAAHPEIAVVLMDLSLRGDEDGLALTRWMRGEDRWRDVPIIATTAHAMEEDREKALRAGCTAYLAKPISPAELISTIRRTLSPTAAVESAGAAAR